MGDDAIEVAMWVADVAYVQRRVAPCIAFAGFAMMIGCGGRHAATASAPDNFATELRGRYAKCAAYRDVGIHTQRGGNHTSFTGPPPASVGALACGVAKTRRIRSRSIRARLSRSRA